MASRYQTKEFKRLVQIQNAMALSGCGVDIITITGFMDDKEFLAHLAHYEKEHGDKVRL